jgi:putative component of membrane protein insertase Oxa1/YidC/SpoIIIJ protein YidD
MKIATVEVVFPSMCTVVCKGEGSVSPATDTMTPHRIDNIRGFLDSFFKTKVRFRHIRSCSSLYVSRNIRDVETLTTLMKEADKIARCSPSAVGKANITKGIPKNPKLPKIVVRVKR